MVDDIRSARSLYRDAYDQLCRLNLTEFCCRIDPKVAHRYRAPHLVEIAKWLQKLECGEIDRLHITTPPRHWKSSLVCEKFSLFYLSRHPEDTVGIFSHGKTLPTRFSMNVRAQIQGNPQFQELYDIKLKEGASNQSDWSLTTAFRSSFQSFGVLSAPTGCGFNLIIVDDPLADAMEAYSPNALEKIITWYRETLRDRLNPGGKIIVVMSRWHENDLAGYLLRESKAGTGEHWVELRLPALAEENDVLGRKPGEALWPDLWGLPELMRVQLAQGSRAFAARYQGSPRALQGNLLDHKKLIMIDPSQLPARWRKLYRRWDLAFSDTKAADFSAGVKIGLDTQGRVIIQHIEQVKGRWPQTAPVIRAKAREDGPMCTVAIECNGTQKGYADEMRMDPRMAGYVVVGDQPQGSKEMRAALWGSRLDDNLDGDGNLKADGIIYCVRDVTWNQLLFDQMDTFPASEHDDMIDGISGGWRLIFPTDAELGLLLEGKPEPKPQPVSPFTETTPWESSIPRIE